MHFPMLAQVSNLRSVSSWGLAFTAISEKLVTLHHCCEIGDLWSVTLAAHTNCLLQGVDFQYDGATMCGACRTWRLLQTFRFELLDHPHCNFGCWSNTWQVTDCTTGGNGNGCSWIVMNGKTWLLLQHYVPTHAEWEKCINVCWDYDQKCWYNCTLSELFLML
jgi:hypothetical protein